MAKKKIMVVEDEGITAMRIKRSLEELGYAVTSTPVTGEEALEHAAEEMPDLVIMDIVLAGEMDGIEAADRIRSRFSIPVVYLTAYSDEKMMSRIKDSSPFGYIIKPFDERELQIVVEIALYKYEVEQKLMTANDELERRVKERTSDLESAVERLEHAEKKIRARAKELNESNTALKVLLNQREEDRKEFEINILSNVKTLIMPSLEQLKRNRDFADDLALLDILESNISNIVSPFSARLSVHYMDFTPREIMVANLVKEGKQDKEIMELLNISLDTVKAHRKSIRKKLNINNKKINLRTKLMSLLE